MRGLRSKLLLGFGGLLLIVLLTSLLAEAVMVQYGRAIGRSYNEDYDSIAACQQMKQIVEGLDLLVMNSLWSGTVEMSQFARLRSAFERQLQVQRNASTLPGERELTDQLSSLWNRYLTQYRAVLNPQTPEPERRRIFLQTLHPESQTIRSVTQSLISENLSALMAVPYDARGAARRAHWAMGTLAVSAVLLAVVFALLIGRVILRPVRDLTRSVREIERGNFDLSVPVSSRDELGALATAFNTMACRLREYRRLAEERLCRTQQTMQMAIDSLPDAVVVTDPSGKIELANRVARGLLPSADGHGVDLNGAPWMAAVRKRIASAPQTTELSDYESTIRIDRDGEVRHFLPRTMPIRDEAANVIGTTVVLADVTSLRRLDETKNSLLSTVSHELKTPLTSARMVLHLLPDQRLGRLNERQLDLLTAARDDVDRLHQIVEDLLDMSRIESGGTLMELQPVAPTELVLGSIGPLEATLHNRRLELQVNVGNELPAVMADRARIGHVFANLLTNAARYTAAAGQIQIVARPVDGGVEFSVHDSGSGIPPEYLPRIFEKFFRVPGQDGGGSGLGLAIAKDIIEAHGGEMRASSASGDGTRFAFTLKCAKTR